MLDYAANGTVYWSLEQITSAFERRCEREGLDASGVLESFLGPDSEWSEGDFWQAVKTNLQAGRVRLVFVADRIPPELRRIIEFLNDQMDPAEIVGVEVPQFVGENQQALVPRVVGVTAEAERRKTVGRSRGRQWDRASFFAELEARRSEAEVEAAQRILSWAEESGMDVKWGTGAKNGSFSPKARVGDDVAHLFSVYTDFNIQLSFGSMLLPPFDRLEGRRDLAHRLEAVNPDFVFRDEKLGGWPFLGRGVLVQGDQVDAFLEVWDWYIGELATPSPQ